MCAENRLKKVGEEDKKEEKADPMLEMMQRIRSGNVNLKKAPPPAQKSKPGGVMAEMATLLVSRTTLSRPYDDCVCVCVCVCVCARVHACVFALTGQQSQQEAGTH